MQLPLPVTRVLAEFVCVAECYDALGCFSVDAGSFNSAWTNKAIDYQGIHLIHAHEKEAEKDEQ